MSQAGIINTSSGPVPPDVPTSFQTDSGIAVPAANIINFFTSDTSANNDNGITDTGSGNTVTHFLTNRTTATITTLDDTLTTILTFPLTGSAGTYYIYGNIQAFNSSTPASGAYSFSGGYRTDGVASASELGAEFHDEFEDAALVTSDVFLNVSGNNVLLQVQGVLGLSINWNALLEYRRVF